MRYKFLLLLPLTFFVWVSYQYFVFDSSMGLWKFKTDVHKSNTSYLVNNNFIWIIGRKGWYLFLRNPVYPRDLVLSQKKEDDGSVHAQFLIQDLQLGWAKCDETLDLRSLRINPKKIEGLGLLHKCSSGPSQNMSKTPYGEYTVEADLLLGKNVLHE